MKRRLFSILLVLALCLSLLPTAAMGFVISDGNATPEEEPDAAVEAVQAMIDALPSVEAVQAMDPEAQGDAYLQTQAAYDAYTALTEEQRAQITGAEILDELFAFFKEMISTLADTDKMFHKMTSEDDIEKDAHYIFVYRAGDECYALSPTGSNFYETIDIPGAELTVYTGNSYVFTLSISETSGAIQLKAANGARVKLNGTDGVFHPSSPGALEIVPSGDGWILKSSSRNLYWNGSAFTVNSSSSTAVEIWTDASGNGGNPGVTPDTITPVDATALPGTYFQVPSLSTFDNLTTGDALVIVMLDQDGNRHFLGRHPVGAEGYSAEQKTDPAGGKYVDVIPDIYSNVVFDHYKKIKYSISGGMGTYKFNSMKIGTYSFYPPNYSGGSGPFRSGSGFNAEVTFEESGSAGQFYVRGNGNSYWLCHSGGGYSMGTSNDPDKPRVRVEVYALVTDATEYTTVQYMDVNGVDVASVSFLPEGSEWTLPTLPDTSEYAFVGWSLEEEFAGYLSLDKSCNLYDTKYQKDSFVDYSAVKDEIIDEYKLVGECQAEKPNKASLKDKKLQDYIEDDDDGNSFLKLYPVFAVRGYDIPVIGLDDDGVPTIGISDWKDRQNDGQQGNLDKDKWLGYVYVEVVRDGVTWVPATKLYFSYHNDNCADINIKFIPRDMAEDEIGSYLTNENDFRDLTEQIYVIDGVVAPQGGSQSGLKLQYNWMSDYAGQLDNVRGGEKITIYVTTKYNVKYYLDGEEITTGEWVNGDLYATFGTKNAFEAVPAIYHVSWDNELSYVMDPKEDTDTFKGFPTDEYGEEYDITRGNYPVFAYDLHHYERDIPIAGAPEALVPKGRILKSLSWDLIGLSDRTSVDWSDTYTLDGKDYGSGNTFYSYLEEEEEAAQKQAPFKLAGEEGDGDKDGNNGIEHRPHTFHLYAETAAPGNLKVSKNVTGTAGDKNQEFTFTVTLVDYPLNDTRGEMTFVDGVATFTLKDGESKTATDLPAGIKYTVTESNNEGYAVTWKNDEGEIPAYDTANAVCGNHADADPEPELGNLKVSKIVTGTAGSTEQHFTFTVELDDDTISGVYGDMTFENGKAVFYMKHGESKTATGLPAGTGYTVTESDNEGYTVRWTNTEGVIPVNGTAEATYTNHWDRLPEPDPEPEPIPPEPEFGGLKVSKTVTGDAGNKEQYFTFTVELDDTTVNGVYGDVTFENGRAVFRLKHGESKTIFGLPAGVQYVVTETDNDGYQVSKSGDKGVIPVEQTAEAAFTNDRRASVTTGDDNNLTLWLTLMAASFCGLAGLALYGRMRKPRYVGRHVAR